MNSVHASDLPSIKIRIVNFVRSNPGFMIDHICRVLNLPQGIVRTAVGELQREGILHPTSTLKLMPRNR